MRREFIQEHRGDRGKEAIDIYDHIDFEGAEGSLFSLHPTVGIMI
jgi:hypothetical protein